jgi:hypothetical protein
MAMATTDYYSAGVERITDYLSALPPRAREMWMDAAYSTWVSERDQDWSHANDSPLERDPA